MSLESSLTGPTPASPGPPAPAVPSLGRRLLSLIPFGDGLAFLAIASVFVAGMTYLGILRFENFFTGNWDLGINQQLLWTTTHGRLLYETGDASFYNVQSFLQVHPTFVALLIAPIYGAAPSPTTLFVVQSLVFVASVIPIFLLVRQLVADRAMVWAVIVLYLASFPVVSSLLYDYHWEAFIPLEYLSFFYLVRSRRYVWSLVPLAFGLLTLEVFPFLVVGVAFLILYEEYAKARPRLHGFLRNRQIQIAIALVIGMVVAYVALRLVQYVAVPVILGSSSGLSQVPGAISSPFAIDLTWKSLGLSSSYWLLLMAAVAFLPLYAPRYLLLTLPWFVYSVFLSPFFSSQFGNQYALVAMATLSVAMVFGYGRVLQIAPRIRAQGILILLLLVSGLALLVASIGWSRTLLSRSISWPLHVLIAILPAGILASIVYMRLRNRRGSASGPPAKAPTWMHPPSRSTVVAATVVAFVAFNVAMSPLNPGNFRATEYPGYSLKYAPNPAAAQMEWVTSQIPANAVVLTSTFLFPYVANNPNAWAVPWYPPAPNQPPFRLPFSPTNLPRYVLTDAFDWGNFPSFITSALSNSSTYGLVAFVYVTGYPGTISLFEIGYLGPTEGRFVSEALPVRYFSAQNLTVGPSGQVRAVNSSKFGEVIDTVPVMHPTISNRTIWSGRTMSLPPGSYELTASLSGGSSSNGNSSEPILTMTGESPNGTSVYNLFVYGSELSPEGWSEVHWFLNLPEAYPEFSFQGYLDYLGGNPNGWISLNYIEVSPT